MTCSPAAWRRLLAVHAGCRAPAAKGIRLPPYACSLHSGLSRRNHALPHPSPWAHDGLDDRLSQRPAHLQIKLLKILAFMGAGDKAASENMYAVIGDAMRRANTGHTIGNAIIYECVRTITSIYPNPALLQAGEAPQARKR